MYIYIHNNIYIHYYIIIHIHTHIHMYIDMGSYMYIMCTTVSSPYYMYKYVHVEASSLWKA